MVQCVLVLYNIRSRHNVGSLFRTADGAGVNKIYLCGYTPAPPHSRISKVALGAERAVPFETVKQTARVITRLKQEGYEIIGLEQTPHSTPYTHYQPPRRLALVAGNEVRGLPRRLYGRCDATLDIPMNGIKKSLNVSVATAIVLYDLIQRMQ